MTTATAFTYPTADELVCKIKQFISRNDIVVPDWDDFVYGFISDEYDAKFSIDSDWFDEDDTDVKDELRDEVLELLGVS